MLREALSIKAKNRIQPKGPHVEEGINYGASTQWDTTRQLNVES